MKSDTKKNTKKKQRFRSHFRKGKAANSGHPTYVYAKKGDTFEFIGLTHASITKGVKNIKLESNPNPKDKRNSYIRPKPGKAKQTKFGKRLFGWLFTKRDKEKVKAVVKANKTAEAKKKQNKKA